MSFTAHIKLEENLRNEEGELDAAELSKDERVDNGRNENEGYVEGVQIFPMILSRTLLQTANFTFI